MSPLWRLSGAIINGQTYGTITGINDNNSNQMLPDDFWIKTFPNPFNNSCKINIKIPAAGHLNIAVYNLLGQQIKEIHNAEVQKGNYSFDFNAAGLSICTL